MNTAKTTTGTNEAVERWMDEGGKDLPRKGLPGSQAASSGDDVSLKARLTDLDETLTSWVKEHPIAATASALSVGYLLGRLLGRR